jgi:hypothetical protein
MQEEIKGIWIRKEIVKVCLFSDDMILYIKHWKNFTPKLLDTIKSFSNVLGYKINLQKSVAFLYASIEKVEKEYSKTIPFTIASEKTKHLGLNLTTDVNVLYKEN